MKIQLNEIIVVSFEVCWARSRNLSLGLGMVMDITRTEEQIVELAVEFKKPVYKEVLAVFAPYLE